MGKFEMQEWEMRIGYRLDAVFFKQAAALGHRRKFPTGPHPNQNVFPFFTGLPRRAARVI